MKPPVPSDTALCADASNGYEDLAAARGREHFVVGSKPGTRAAAGCHDIQNVNSLHARSGKFIEPFCGPATKNLYGYIRWLEVRMAGVQPAGVVRASQRAPLRQDRAGPDQTSSEHHDLHAEQAGR